MFSYLFCLYCHQVKTQVQLVIIIIIIIIIICTLSSITLPSARRSPEKVQYIYFIEIKLIVSVTVDVIQGTQKGVVVALASLPAPQQLASN
jgi:hypothetical protein